jgi:SAM-dependent methyltransferase
MTANDFELRYRADPDPWSYATSDYEREKYATTLRACGSGPFVSALELGGSIGVFSVLLAPRCGTLTTIDAAPTAVRIAGARLARHPNVRVLLGQIPDAIPATEYAHDLIVASEILYYLEEQELEQTLAVLHRSLGHGGRLVAVHWRPSGPERPFTAAEVHQRLHAQPWLISVCSKTADRYLLDVLKAR